MARRDGIVWAGIRAMVDVGDRRTKNFKTGPIVRHPDQWADGSAAVAYHEEVIRAVLESAGVHLVERILALKCGVADGEAEEFVRMMLDDDPALDA